MGSGRLRVSESGNPKVLIQTKPLPYSPEPYSPSTQALTIHFEVCMRGGGGGGGQGSPTSGIVYLVRFEVHALVQGCS